MKLGCIMAGALIIICPVGFCEKAMVDPAIDTLEPFCYLAKSSVATGVMGSPERSQITFDGAIKTPSAELCFATGKPLKPAFARQKQLLEGWIPVVTAWWKDGTMDYAIETFATGVGPSPEANTVNFVRFQAQNVGKKPARAQFASMLRFSGIDHRFPPSGGFSPNWKYGMTTNTAVRDGKVLLIFPAGARCEAVQGQAYKVPFSGREYSIAERMEVCLANYEADLVPGEVRTFDFIMPVTPRDVSDPLVAKLSSMEYGPARGRVVNTWRALLAKCTQLTIPEGKAADTWRAGLMYNWMFLEREGGKWTQKEQPFHDWQRDPVRLVGKRASEFPDICRCYELYGFDHDIMHPKHEPDWTRILGVSPSELLNPDDPQISATLIGEVQEGLIVGGSGEFLTPYGTMTEAVYYVLRGEQEQALQRYYAFLLHTGNCQEAFSFGAAPWGDRDSTYAMPPSGGSSAVCNTMLRSMLVLERGDTTSGKQRDLHLFNVVSPAWALIGKELAIRNAPTELGTISASLKFSNKGTTFTFEGKLRQQPRNIVLHLPYFTQLTSFTCNARSAREEKGSIVFSPDVTRAEVQWTRNNKANYYSFESAVDSYKEEYRRRYREYRQKGGKPVPVEAPALQRSSRRR